MALDPEFLQMLVCPASRKPLRELPAHELAALNARIARGAVHNRGGSEVARALEGGLVPEGDRVVYPILDGIPILLTSEAIALDAEDGTKARQQS
ncbi:MAG: Trm112 family protein [Planctomycetota bacterium]